MELTGKKGIGNLLKIFLQICFYVGILVLVGLPFVLNLMGLNLNACMFVIYPNGIVLLIIAKKFIKLFDSLKNNEPFSEKNVKILKRAGITALVGSFLWLLDFLYEVFLAKSETIVSNLALIFLCIFFLGVAIAVYILSELFKQATEYKQENELTI